MIRNKNAWRWSLDSRDPDYEDPPGCSDIEQEEPEPELESPDDDDPRNSGPMHYQPAGGDV